MVLNSIVWTAGVEVPKDGVKSKPLTEDELNANLDNKGKKVRLKLVGPVECKRIPAAPVQAEREAAFLQSASPSSAKPTAESPVSTIQNPRSPHGVTISWKLSNVVFPARTLVELEKP